MANVFLTPTVITKEFLMYLKNALVFANIAYKEYKKEFGKKIGDTVAIRKPVMFEVHDGADISTTIQDISEQSIDLVINKRKHIAFSCTSKDLTLTIEEFGPRYLESAAISLADQVDSDLADLEKELFFSVGTAGTTPSSFSDFGAIARKMNKGCVPSDKRVLILDPDATWAMLDGLKGLYSPAMVEGMVRRGLLGTIGNFELFESNHIKNHTNGAWGGTPAVNGANQGITQGRTGGAALITDGWSSSATAIPSEGDVFTIADVYGVNPVSKAVRNDLQQFVVTADGVNDASGNITLAIDPQIITGGAYQTVYTVPANSALLTFQGTAATAHVTNIAAHRNCLALATVPIDIPTDANGARKESDGISIRTIMGFDIKTDTQIVRMDILYGVKAIRPEFGVKLLG